MTTIWRGSNGWRGEEDLDFDHETENFFDLRFVLPVYRDVCKKSIFLPLVQSCCQINIRFNSIRNLIFVFNHKNKFGIKKLVSDDFNIIKFFRFLTSSNFLLFFYAIKILSQKNYII